MPRTLCVLVLSLLLFSTACDGGGDGGENGETLTAQLSRAELIEKVDEICSVGRSQLENLEPPKSLKESAPFLREILPVIRDQLVEIRELGEPPADGREIYLQWIEARDGIVETTAKMIGAAEEGDEDQFQQLAALQQGLDQQADKAANEYGFKVCGATSGTEPSPEPSL